MTQVDGRARRTTSDRQSSASIVRTAAHMDTVVSVEVVRPAPESDCAAAVERAFGWFRELEARCTRFNPESELMRLCARPGTANPVSETLYKVIELALAVAEASAGSFDPTLGGVMHQRGFDRNYQTGERVPAVIEADPSANYRDVLLDPRNRTVTLLRPLVLDLGAVAKGFAIDLAAVELRPFEHFAINAGGDLYLAGNNIENTPWKVGVRNPRWPGHLADTLHVSDAAVCTSGDYERSRPDGGAGHHIFDPRSGESTTESASVTVVAPTAALADSLATAAFVLGPRRGIQLLEENGVEGMLITPALTAIETRGFGAYRR